MKRVDPHKAWTIGIVVVVVLALFILLFYGRVLGAGQAANVGLNEVAVIDVTGDVGELVDVHIDVNSGQELGVVGVVLTYDESVLEYHSVVPASGLGIIASNQPDVTVDGEVRFGLHGSTDDDTVVFNAVGVDRRLATVKFRIIVPTTTPSEITLTDDSIIDGGVTLVSGTVTGVLKSDGASCLLDNECSSGQCMLLVCNTDGDADGVILANDCDDDDFAINPGATEICGNGVDEDCNPINDLCGLGVDCSSSDQCVAGLVCKDTCVVNTPPVADTNGDLTLYGTPGESQTFTLAATDADGDDVLSYSLPTSNNLAEGTATLAGDTVTYTFSENPTSGPHQLDYTFDDGYVNPITGTFDLTLEWCGDTVVNGGEFCDGEGCLDDCSAAEDGYACVGVCHNVLQVATGETFESTDDLPSGFSLSLLNTPQGVVVISGSQFTYTPTNVAVGTLDLLELKFQGPQGIQIPLTVFMEVVDAPEGDADDDGVLDGVDECPGTAESLPVITDGAAAGCILGDVDMNGVINPQDAVQILKYVVAADPTTILNEKQLVLAETNCVGPVNPQDAVQILKLVVGSINAITC